MNTYTLEGSFVAKVKANSYNEAMDIFDDDSLSNIKELYIECVTEYDKMEKIDTLHLTGQNSINLFIPTKEYIQKVIKTNRKISEGITIIPTEDGFMVHDDSLDLSFLDEIRNATTEEQKGINDYVDSISHNTEINLFDYLN